MLPDKKKPARLAAGGLSHLLGRLDSGERPSMLDGPVVVMPEDGGCCHKVQYNRIRGGRAGPILYEFVVPVCWYAPRA